MLSLTDCFKLINLFNAVKIMKLISVTYLSLLLIVPLVSAPLSVQTTTVNFNVRKGDWAVAESWNPIGVPDGNVVGVITHARIATISSQIKESPNIIRVGNNPNGGTLDLIDGSITATNLQVASTNLSNGAVNLTGGSLTISNSTLVASNNITPNLGSLNLSGGTFSWGDNMTIGSAGTGNLSITGANGNYSGNNLTAGANAKFTFVLSAEGVSSLSASGDFTIADGASIVVDASAYTGTGPFTLIDWQGYRNGSFHNVTITGFPGSLVYDDTARILSVIPKP
jgi:hypothetical protein